MTQNTKVVGASLKPCPFCGSVNISEGEVLTSNPNGGASTQSMCRDCGALGPDAHLREGEIDYGSTKATAAWNRRPAFVNSESPQLWKSIPATPPVEVMEWYGDQFSSPVLLRDGEEILPVVARWSFIDDGWIDAQFTGGPSPSDYEWLNSRASVKHWLLLSAAASIAPTAEQEDHIADERKLVAAEQTEGVHDWRPIETAPKTGRTLLLGYPNSAGKWRTVRGQWMSEAYIAEYWEEPDDVEPGWFETSAEADDVPNCWPITPTHWMQLPAAPASSAGDQA